VRIGAVLAYAAVRAVRFSSMPCPSVTRKRKFGPVHIRILLEKATKGLPLIVDKDWYRAL
jgi:hypothetical protein